MPIKDQLFELMDKAKEAKKKNPHLALCHEDNPPANNRPVSLLLKSSKTLSLSKEEPKIDVAAFLKTYLASKGVPAVVKESEVKESIAKSAPTSPPCPPPNLTAQFLMKQFEEPVEPSQELNADLHVALLKSMKAELSSQLRKRK